MTVNNVLGVWSENGVKNPKRNSSPRLKTKACFSNLFTAMSDSTQPLKQARLDSMSIPKLEEMSEEPSSGHPVCYECESAHPIVFCTDCNVLYCTDCYDELHKGKKFRSHKVESVDTLNPSSLSTATIPRALPLPADPLMKSPYVVNAAFNELMSRITELQKNFSLHKYHSNVLPFIGSTGVGKTRTIIQLTRRHPFVDTACSYAAFPRLEKSEELPSWPKSTHRLITWMSDILSDCPLDPCVMSVVLCQILVLSVFKMTVVSASDDSGESWLGYHNTIVGNCRDLFNVLEKAKFFNPSDFSIDDFTKYLVESSDLPKFPKFVLFLDEVGTLISHEVSVFPTGWNLYRALRHAARNLFYALELKKKSCLIVVSGTHTSLSNFYHFPVRSSFYRPDALVPYASFKVKTGRTIPPLIVNPQQYNPSQIITEDKTPKAFKHYYSDEYAFVAPGLSLSLVLSLRPLWISYFVSNPTSFLDDVQGKVWGALNLVSQKFGDVCYGTVVAALLLILGSVTSVPESILSLLIESSFGSLECIPISSTSPLTFADHKSDIIFVTRPTIDPLVYSFVGQK
ncbi:hypothetical protein GEMRC1_010476 [Eukaryota sp. GEM-RC1]